MTGCLDVGHTDQSVLVRKPLPVTLSHTCRILGGYGPLKENLPGCRQGADLHRSSGFAGARPDDQHIQAPNPRCSNAPAEILCKSRASQRKCFHAVSCLSASATWSDRTRWRRFLRHWDFGARKRDGILQTETNCLWRWRRR